jgi:hypothetical protein
MTLILIHSSGHYPAFYVNVTKTMLAALREATKAGWTLSETPEGCALMDEIRQLAQVEGPPRFCDYV